MLSSIRKITTAILGALCLFGCVPQLAPPVSGVVTQLTVQNDAQHISWELTKDQLDKLYLWLQAHQSDWHGSLVGPPPPTYSISVRHSDGVRTKIDLYSLNESWQHVVFIYVGRDGKFVGGGAMTLPTEDIANLKEMLAEKAASPPQ